MAYGYRTRRLRDDYDGFNDDYTRSTIVVLSDNCGEPSEAPTGILGPDGIMMMRVLTPLAIGFIHFPIKD